MTRRRDVVSGTANRESGESDMSGPPVVDRCSESQRPGQTSMRAPPLPPVMRRRDRRQRPDPTRNVRLGSRDDGLVLRSVAIGVVLSVLASGCALME